MAEQSPALLERQIWLPREPRRMDNLEPAIEMRFHGDWWHTIFDTSKGFEVTLGPIGINLGTFDAIEAAKACAEDNARVRSLNALKSARKEIGNAEVVLGALR
jgi:hypothetical protein